MISLGLGPSAAVAGGERPAPPSLAGRADAGPTPPFADFFQHLLGRWAGDPDAGKDLEAAAAPDVPAKRAPRHEPDAVDLPGAEQQDTDTTPLAPTVVGLEPWLDVSTRPSRPARGLPHPDDSASGTGEPTGAAPALSPAPPTHAPLANVPSRRQATAAPAGDGWAAHDNRPEPPPDFDAPLRVPVTAGDEPDGRQEASGLPRAIQAAAISPRAQDVLAALLNRGPDNPPGAIVNPPQTVPGRGLAMASEAAGPPRDAPPGPFPVVSEAGSEPVVPRATDMPQSPRPTAVGRPSPAAHARPGVAPLPAAMPDAMPDAPGPPSAAARAFTDGTSPQGTEPGRVEPPSATAREMAATPRSAAEPPAPTTHARRVPAPVAAEEGQGASWSVPLTNSRGLAEAAMPDRARAADPTRMTLPHLPVVAPTTGQAASGQARAEGAGLAAPPAQPPDVELPDQIVQSLRLQATAGGGEARMHLRPEYLGELTVRVVVDNGVVTARLEAEVPAVREWIERHEVSLRQALGAHGLTLDELIVSDKAAGDQSRDQEHEGQSNRQDPDQPSPRGRRRRPDEASPRFEVVA